MFSFELPRRAQHCDLYGLHADTWALTVIEVAKQRPYVLVVCTDGQEALHMETLCQALAPDIPCTLFPDWELLPYERFHVHQEMVSSRLKVLWELLHAPRGLYLIAQNTLLQKVVPPAFILHHAMTFHVGQTLSKQHFAEHLRCAGYREVAWVEEPGTCAIKGSLIDVYPMGAKHPIRIDFFDDEISMLKVFDPETQRSETQTLEQFHLMPAREYPFEKDDQKAFTQAFKAFFHLESSPLLEFIQKGLPFAGIHFYLPLFFELVSFLSYWPEDGIVCFHPQARSRLEDFEALIEKRFTQLNVDRRSPLLPPEKLYLRKDALYQAIKSFAHIRAYTTIPETLHAARGAYLIPLPRPDMPPYDAHSSLFEAAQKLLRKHPQARVLIAASSPGRLSALHELARSQGIHAPILSSWADFCAEDSAWALIQLPLQSGWVMEDPPCLVISDDAYHPHARLHSQSKRQARSALPSTAESIRSLPELSPGCYVVHIEYGIGQFLGVETLSYSGSPMEYLVIGYAHDDKIYLPITHIDALHLYTPLANSSWTLDRLGSDAFAKQKRKALHQLRDHAAHLLEIYAQRHQAQGQALPLPANYEAFCESFAFEETPDQTRAIQEVLKDMAQSHPMDRLVVGDVGFGKTEVAMRAAFVACMNHCQVLVLCPTTLLCHQHVQTFQDRFADWPLRIAEISRFQNLQAFEKVAEDLRQGRVDIVIATHKILHYDNLFKNLGLLIIDEEHRFGVKQKERLKKTYAHVDILSMTATPIPRTLNMALSRMRDLSIIATPPLKRLAIKTIVAPYSESLLSEAITREIMRSGQVYYLYNDIATIETMAHHLKALFPSLSLEIAHGQMPKKDLERIVRDFYHQRFSILLCTTIIETGIDVPLANTILIHDADHFGLAQLHQIRGRVGRSAHQAYCYCLTQPLRRLTPEAEQRLQALQAHDALGSGFILAQHDLEIRGAGDLLGLAQSGHMAPLGLGLFMELLDKTVQALQNNPETTVETLMEDRPLDLKLPIELRIDPAYIPDVALRLKYYQQLKKVQTLEALEAWKYDLRDTYGPCPEGLTNLITIRQLQLRFKDAAVRLQRWDAQGLVLQILDFAHWQVDALLVWIQKNAQDVRLKGQDSIIILFKAFDHHVRTIESFLDFAKKDKP